ncbi:MAG: TatD family hydrolase [Pseudomonadota bacterium]
MFTDSHAHLDYDSYDQDRSDMLARARAAGVTKILSVSLGPEPERWEKAVRLFGSRPDVRLAFGVHPHDVARITEETPIRLREYLARPDAAALGEVGLDFFHDRSSRDEQIQHFENFLDLALELGLPVSIHSRDAFEETYSAVRRRDLFRRVGGVMHCFTGTLEQAKSLVDLGAHIGFSGIVTFKNAGGLREVLGYVPMDRILIETDAPFLAPDPYRGKRNEPAYVVRVAQAVAQIKALPIEEVGRVTSENAARLFNF